ncbi:MAG TPA: metal-sulfur cluster assembly factor [Spirochaetota bacterium]|nr:metal-sulfur cluster assembly factor [Spirochaetota bacterium]
MERIHKAIFIILLSTLAVLIYLSIPAGGVKDEYKWKNKSSSNGTVLQNLTSSDVLEKLKSVKDPELDVNIIDLGLIYDLKLNEGNLNMVMTLTFKRCPYAAQLIENVKSALMSMEGIKTVNLEITFEPLWSWERVKPEVRDSIIHNFKELGIIEEAAQ